MTRSIRGLSLSQIIEKLAPYLIVWRSYFGFCPRIPIKGELSHVEFAASSMEGIYCSSPSTAHTMSGNASVRMNVGSNEISTPAISVTNCGSAFTLPSVAIRPPCCSVTAGRCAVVSMEQLRKRRGSLVADADRDPRNALIA
jgi:hypothetical protein